MTRRLLALLLVAVLLASLPPASWVAAQTPSRPSTPPTPSPELEIEPQLLNAIAAEGATGYLIYFRDRPDLSAAQEMDWQERGRFVMQALRDAAEQSQARVRKYLDGAGADYQSFWIDNVIAVQGSTRATFDGLRGYPEVAALRAPRVLGVIEPDATAVANAISTVVEPNIVHVQADDAWGLGSDGAGLVVANIDTGVRYTHQALVGSYRGNNLDGTFDHNYNWWDPYGAFAYPADENGHGSHTMGTMVGGDGTNAIGMAPGARWIACRGCDSSNCTDAALLACAQWVAAPWNLAGASPDPDARPHVVNNSWGDCGTSYDGWFQTVVDNWHAAGVYPIFSAGNASNCSYPAPPACGSVGNPGRYGNVTAVGSTGQSNGAYAAHSNRGPTDDPDTVNGGSYPTIKPQVVAPGLSIRSAVNSSDTAYESWGGTSMSAPHVAGLVALIWQAAPCLVGDYATTEALIQGSAVAITTGLPGACSGEGPGQYPNQSTGWGEIDALEAVELALGACNQLVGLVTDSGSGDPIVGARVEAVSGVGTFAGVTDDAGHYAIHLPPDTYTVGVAAYGWMPVEYAGIMIDEATETLDSSLDAAGRHTLQGTVRDADGGWPLYAHIRVSGAPIDPPAPNNDFWTDPVAGEFSVELAGGITYTLRTEAWASGYVSATTAAGPLGDDLVSTIHLDVDPAACSAPGHTLTSLTSQGLEVADGGDHVGDVSLQTCSVETGGLIVGGVYDATTGLPLNGATVTSSSGHVSISGPTDELAVSDGFFTLFSSRVYTEGATTITGTLGGGYVAGAASVAVPETGAVMQDLLLTAGLVTVAPPTLTVALTTGTSASLPITVTNEGTAPAAVDICVAPRGGVTGMAPTPASERAPVIASGGPERLTPSGPAGTPDTMPAPVLASDQVVQDGGFEAGTPSPYWDESSTNFGTPICSATMCGTGGGTAGPRSGEYWIWLGGIDAYEQGSVSQEVIIPEGVATLSFWLWMGQVGNVADYVRVTMDGNEIWAATGADGAQYTGYTRVSVDATDFADGGAHVIAIESEEAVGSTGNYHVDDVAITVDACGAVPWLSASPMTATVPSGGQQVIAITFDAGVPEATAAGTYLAQLRFDAPTPYEAPVVPVTLTVALPAYSVSATASPTEGGVVTTSPAQDTYVAGEQVVLTAAPNTGWTFSGWGGDGSGTTNPLTVTVDRDLSVTASFARQSRALTVATAGAGTGAVTPSAGVHSYPYGQVVTLTAEADAGSVFAGWSGAVASSASAVSVTMTANRAVTATFGLVAPAPVVAFSWQPENPVAGEMVTFAAVVTGTGPYTYTWYFGDGSNPVVTGEATVGHAFPASTTSATYTVQVSVVGSAGPEPGIRMRQVRVGATPPKAPSRLLLPVALKNWYRGPYRADDPYYAQQWGLTRIGVERAWPLSRGAGVVVAILDSGVDMNHPDLVAKLVSGYDMVNDDDWPQDDNGHGTHVAGIAAASTGNHLGIAGVGWDASIMPVKVMDADGSGWSYDIAYGIVGAVESGARVINLSLGMENWSEILEAATDYAYSHGVLVVASAGNCGDPYSYAANGCSRPNPVIYPAANPNVFAVGATTSSDARAPYSEYGSFVDVAAPGHNILSTIWDSTYDHESGTSMAAPFVTGLASLVWSCNPALSNAQVAQIIAGASRDLGASGQDSYFGWGRVDAGAAAVAACSGTGLAGLSEWNEPTVARDAQALAQEARDRGSPVRPGVILVRTLAMTGAEDLPRLLGLSAAAIESELPALGYARLRVPEGQERDLAALLMAEGVVEFAEPDYLLTLWP